MDNVNDVQGKINQFLDGVKNKDYSKRLKIFRKAKGIEVKQRKLRFFTKENDISEKVNDLRVLMDSKISHEDLKDLREKVSKGLRALPKTTSVFLKIFHSINGVTTTRKQMEFLNNALASLDPKARSDKELYPGECGFFMKNSALHENKNVFFVYFRHSLLQHNPILVLDKLVETIKNEGLNWENIDLLDVKYLQDSLEEMPGFDAGGLQSDFLNSLISGSIQHLMKEGKFNQPFSDEDKGRWETLGHLMMFASKQKVVLGKIFEPEIYSIIQKAMQRKDLAKDDQLISLYCERRVKSRQGPFTAQDAIVLQLLAKEPSKLTAEELETLIKSTTYATLYEDYPSSWETDVGEIPSREILEKNREFIWKKAMQDNGRTELSVQDLRNALIKEARQEGSAHPIFYLAQVFSEYYSRMVPEPEQLEVRIQGERFSKENMLIALKMDVPEENQKWITQWVNESEAETLMRFLKAATGSTGIQQVTFKPQNNKNEGLIVFSSCGKGLWVDFSRFSDYEKFKEHLNLSIDLALKAGFDKE